MPVNNLREVLRRVINCTFTFQLFNNFFLFEPTHIIPNFFFRVTALVWKFPVTYFQSHNESSTFPTLLQINLDQSFFLFP